MAVDYFLKIDTIPGESQDSKHKDEIDLESWSFGASQSGTMHSGGGGGTGKVSLQDLNFVTRVSKASPKLFLACCNGEHIKKAVLTARKAGKDQQEYYKITLSEVLVSSYQDGGSGGSDIVPVNQVSLNFAEIQVEYKEQKPDGTLGGSTKVGWNAKTNKAV